MYFIGVLNTKLLRGTVAIKVTSLREPRLCFLQSKFSSQGNTSNSWGEESYSSPDSSKRK